ncbi:MAG: hypothetical protein SGPRY_005371 [Prymnesium sp.]
MGNGRPHLTSLASCLEALRLRFGLHVFQTYLIDALVPGDAVGGASVALLLHPPNHYTSARGLVGREQLRTRLLGKLGFSVIDIPSEMWDGLRTDEAKLQSLRDLLRPHMKGSDQIP